MTWSPPLFNQSVADCKFIFRTEMLESGAASALCSMGCSEVLLVLHGGAQGPGNIPFRAWLVVYHCLLQPGYGFSFFGKPYLLVRLYILWITQAEQLFFGSYER